jgi:hypothetical protein
MNVLAMDRRAVAGRDKRSELARKGPNKSGATRGGKRRDSVWRGREASGGLAQAAGSQDPSMRAMPSTVGAHKGQAEETRGEGRSLKN